MIKVSTDNINVIQFMKYYLIKVRIEFTLSISKQNEFSDFVVFIESSPYSRQTSVH